MEHTLALDKLATGQRDNHRERTYRPYRNINKANTSNSVNNTLKKGKMNIL